MSRQRNIFLICGSARSGKNQVADYMKECIDYYFSTERTLIRGNAQTVKNIAKNKYNWDEEKDEKGRQLLIDITNEGYDKDRFYWEKETLCAFGIHNHYNPEVDYLIIPDWRYSQTEEFFKEFLPSSVYKVTTFRVTRDNKPKGTHENHITENDFKGFEVDYEISNNGTLEELFNYIKSNIVNWL